MNWIEKRASFPNLTGEYPITGYEAHAESGGLAWITCMYVDDKPAFQYGAWLGAQRSGSSVVYDLESAKRGAENALIFLQIAKNQAMRQEKGFEQPQQPKLKARVEIVPLESSTQPFKFTVHVYGPETPESRKFAENLARLAIQDKYQGRQPRTVNYTIRFEK